MKASRRRFLQYLSAAGASLALIRVSDAIAAESHQRVIPSSNEAIPSIGMGSWRD